MMKTRILSLQLPCSNENGGREEEEEHKIWSQKNAGSFLGTAFLFFLSFFSPIYVTLSKFLTFPMTQFLTYQMGIINILYHKGCCY